MRFSSTINLPDSAPLGEPLWRGKHNLDDLAKLKKGDPLTFGSQYQQSPTKATGGLFKNSYWRYYSELPELAVMKIYCDTAQKTAEHNDFTVFQCWGRALESKNIYLIDQMRGKWEAPQIESNLVAFYEKHRPTIYKPVGVSSVKVEDKSSGSSLIQTIEQDYSIPIEGIPRYKDKVVRAYGGIKYLSAGFVHLPIVSPNENWVDDYVDEFTKFSPLMNHAHDDQIDPTLDAIEDLIIDINGDYNQNNIG